MDENVTNANLEEQESQTTQTSATTTAQTGEATTEKVSSLQKFIEGLFGGKKADESTSEGKGGGTSKEDTTMTPEIKEESKSFSEADVNSAIEAAKLKWLEEQAEAERMKALSPAQLKEEERLKKEEELTTLKNQLLQRELHDQAIAALDKEGFPVRLAENLNYTNKEKMEESLKSTMEVFKESLKTAVDTRLRGKTPEGLGGAASAENMIKDQIAKNIRGGMM